MVRITSNIVNEARKYLGAWKRASRETGREIDEEFMMREVAGLLRVDYVMLALHLSKKKRKRNKKTPR